ncbi:hypothetical protein NHX12_031624 [Muraenolepis orangiensis]|uniref:CKK domain-containing protein n=1 Tax=Muraenolepis orangiensis TaxID=630683 RepID=A0A9Q0E4T7_9TELE|nr:hypothetical protein NHX12_031624 [Muraenolepis orangiensis]
MVDSNNATTTTPRRSFAVPDVQPLDVYDGARGRVCASVGWLLAKSYGNAESIPVDLREPFYRDQYEQEHLKPPVTRLLLSSELYYIVALMPLLARRGTPPRDQDAPVTEADLRRKPIKMSAHLALMDALMAVGAMETVAAVKKRGTAELLGGGSDWQAMLLHWVNELNQKLRQSEEGSQEDPAQTNPEPQPVQPTCPTRWYWKLVPLRYRKDKMQSRQKPVFPTVKEVKDLSTGCAVVAVMHYYCPGLLRLEDVCMKDSMSPADSLYNLQIIREFCESCLKSCCPMTLEDMLYAPAELQSNWLSFLAELLNWFEVKKPEFVQPKDSSENTGKTWSRKSLSDVDIVMGDPVITRSVSSDQLPYTPPEELARPLNKPNVPQRPSWVTQSPGPPRLAENGHRENETGELPTIEEALQIIHNESKMEPRLHPDGAPDGFYLHSPDDLAGGRHDGGPVSCSAPSRSGMMYRPAAPEEPREPKRGRKASEGSRDDDSVLRDGSVDSDASEDPPKARSGPATPAAVAPLPYRSHSKESPDSGVKMTSFAERKKKHGPESPKTSEPPAAPRAASWAQAAEEGPAKSPQLTNEMSELGVRLEEKRKAIEAQKKRIEAIFAKHRQRLGKSAFLQLKKGQREDGGEGAEENLPSADGEHSNLTLEERLARLEEDEQERDKRHPAKDEDGGNKLGVQTDEEAAPPKAGGPPGDKATAPLGDYNNAVSKLNAALSSLQSDMQRLSEQQNQLIRKKPAAPPGNRSWVIPPSPSSSPRTSTPSPHVHRRAQSVPPKSPKHHQAQPMDPKGPMLFRVLTPPQNVDRIPHLRRVSPWQCKVQTSSSFSIGNSSDAQEESLSDGPTPVPTPTPTARLQGEDALSEGGSNDDQSIFSMDLEAGSAQALARKERPAVGGSSSGAPSECSFDSDVPAAAMFNGSKRGSLIEISLDVTEPELKGLGFFFKDDKVRPEDEMAQRRAALLEKQQKRADEMKKRKLEQEKEKEANKPQWMTIEGWGDKGDSQEYERRHQLKIMEDLDKVLRQKPTTVRGVKKQRPKTVFRDDSDISRSPAKGFMGSRLNKVYSHSTMNLSSVANDLSVRKSPSRSHSPARRLSHQNGERDWENDSNISLPIPEYTGPKLYKEPSFKSNKFIIHNAISRCCMAGKVNEPAKNKIVEEMEKSAANHFLILFRDASCQFRAVYTMNPETDEMVRLTGIGPRVVAPEMVESIFKYSSDRKQFTAIPSKTMSMSVDAFTIPAHLWQKRPATPKKLGTPK